MGTILNTKYIANQKVIVKVRLNIEEVFALKNAIKNINLFSDDLFLHHAGLIKRGKQGVTKYFQVPFSLRLRKLGPFDSLSYHKIELESKVYFVYVIKKDLLLTGHF